MKAIQIDRYGGPEVLVRRELPIPSPGVDEVLIRIAYSGINFMDVHTRQGKYRDSRTYPQVLPTTLGIEGAGTIEAVGANVSQFLVEDRVAYCLCWGSYAEYAVVPAWRVVPVPHELPLELAAASIFHGLTAHYLAYDLGKLGPGVTCLVHAASGASANCSCNWAPVSARSYMPRPVLKKKLKWRAHVALLLPFSTKTDSLRIR
jgi:NADPH:quinone reductase